MARRACDCEKHAPEGFLTSGVRTDGERWTCPKCRAVWVHYCEEAEGCSWQRLPRRHVMHKGKGK
jgi:Zn-finger nucleic acid-binding protein